jgi:hypothetical protein
VNSKPTKSAEASTITEQHAKSPYAVLEPKNAIYLSQELTDYADLSLQSTRSERFVVYAEVTDV